MRKLSSVAAAIALPLLAAAAVSPAYEDHTHPSKVFNGPRNYRIFLPAGYAATNQRYPVIYYFHGHSDRYTLERYDQGLDTVPKIAAFVATHPVIVVAADGYIARDYTGFYGGSPYDVRFDGGQFDYGEYFRELVEHIDSTWRTLPSRRNRATSGLSMGGFMSLYLSARYPDLVGSASAFNPGPEFYAGEPGRRSLWRPKDHVDNHEFTRVRLVRASGDWISQYHEETRAAYASHPTLNFEFRQDEYHRHWATSIGETFEFHSTAFADAALDTKPESWTYTSAQKSFEVRGVRVEAGVKGPALIRLEHVAQGGLRVTTRQYAPDGPPAVCDHLSITTAALYQGGARYRVLDHDWLRNATRESSAVADATGRLNLNTGCSNHEISFIGPGTGAQPPVLLPVTSRDFPRVLPGRAITLPLRVYNPRDAAQDVRVELHSDYPTVAISNTTPVAVTIAKSAETNLGAKFPLQFTAAEGDFSRVRLQLKITYDGYHETSSLIDVLVAPDPLPQARNIEILDGRTRAFSLFFQKGNQGGGSATDRTVTEGTGNGNGTLEPGEEATIWLRLAQGLDPFDKNNWCRTKIYTDSPYLIETADIQEEKRREWTGAQNRTSRVRLSPDTPPGTEIPVILDCESFSFTFMPDVRYGKDPLYQAFQFHRHHLFAWTWKAGSRQLETGRE